MSENTKNRINIFGVYFDIDNRAALLRKIQVKLSAGKKFIIVTPNPEQIMLAQKDALFLKILRSADISLPDGIGVVAAYNLLKLPDYEPRFKRFFILLGKGLKIGYSIMFDRKSLENDFSVIRGREFFLELIKLANKRGLKVFLLGGEHGEARNTGNLLKVNYKKVKIMYFEGPGLSVSGEPLTQEDRSLEIKAVKLINEFEPDLLIVGMSAPRQEKWTYRWINRLDIKGAMMVGGTFRYVSGQVKLPPKQIAEYGLEWLWRLFTGSQKAGRVLNAFPAFPLRVFNYKLNRGLKPSA